ncbi:MAG TPA: hypothetical protein VFE96_04460 [Candidatus Bathyarchaeia archaeon]|nr:hypothetical protein [Candidatus Bathyarchaeia archaeon]
MAKQGTGSSSGLALAIGGLTLVIHYLIHPLGENSVYIKQWIWIPAHLIGAAAWILILAGTFGFYNQYGKTLGRLGSIGFVLALIGGSTRPGELLFLGAIAGPLIASQTPAMIDPGGVLYMPLLLAVGVATAIYGVGYLLIAIPVLRAQVVPKGWTWLVIFSILLAIVTLTAYALGAGVFALGSVAGVIFSFGLVGWGYSLWSGWKPEAPHKT